MKVSASSSDPYLYLQGAEFRLTAAAEPSAVYYGKTDADGRLVWYSTDRYEEADRLNTLPGGTYTLEEKTAPAGYKRSTETWEVVIRRNGTLKSITSSEKGTVIPAVTDEVNGREVVYYLYRNEALYELPENGGNGIYPYLISGILLMGAAAWILYKGKKRSSEL